MQAKNILIFNGRFPAILDCMRNLAYAGHKIFLVETTPHYLSRFSNSVHKHFYIPSFKVSPKAYMKHLVSIIQEHKIDILIPTWEEIFFLAKHLDEIPPTCDVPIASYELLHQLHNKSTFIDLCCSLGIKTPKTYRITSKQDLLDCPLEKYALKSCYSRSSQSVYQVSNKEDLPEIQPTMQRPWIAQEWIYGENFCTYSVCHKGKVHAHVTYPMEFVIQNKHAVNPTVGSYCLAFKNVEHKKILDWIKDFAAKTNFTGQIAFDFIERENGDIYAIECNPRLTSGVVLFDKKDRLDKAFCGVNKEIIMPTKRVYKKLFMGMLLWGWQAAFASNKFFLYLKQLFQYKDIIFSFRDLKPFFYMPFLGIRYWLDCRKSKKPMLQLFTDDIDYNG